MRRSALLSARLRTALLPLVLACASIALSSVAAQEPPPEPLEPLAWPKLSTDAAQRLHRVQQALPKLAADDDAGFEKLRAEIAGIGPAACPRLLKDLAKAAEKAEEGAPLVERLRALLELVAVDPALVPLVARELEHASPAVRLWSAERLLAWADPRALDAVRARAPKEKDSFVRGTLVLLRCTLGDVEALPELEALLEKEWARWRGRAHAALRGLRGKATSEAMLERLRSAEDERERLFALRVLASVGERGAIDAVASYLDADARSIREAAVNALRGIVDGQEPRYDVSVFDLVELVEAWKKRLPSLRR
jgi:hypothetical protein